MELFFKYFYQFYHQCLYSTEKKIKITSLLSNVRSSHDKQDENSSFLSIVHTIIRSTATCLSNLFFKFRFRRMFIPSRSSNLETNQLRKSRVNYLSPDLWHSVTFTSRQYIFSFCLFMLQ